MDDINTKKIKLIDKIKSVILSKSSSYVEKHFGISKTSSVFAKKIQANYIKSLNKKKKEEFTPVYEIILKQLQAGNEQIRCAAVKALIDIMKNNEYEKEIKNELIFFARYNDKSSDSVKMVKSFFLNK